MVINTNIKAVNAVQSLNKNMSDLSVDIRKLSSGRRIASAGDDPAGLALSEELRSQMRGTKQALRNIQDGVSFIQTAGSYLQTVSEQVQRMRELSIQAANSIYTDEQRNLIQDEFTQISAEIDRINISAQYNNRLIFESDDNPGANLGITDTQTNSAITATANTQAEKGLLLISHIGPNANSLNDNAISFQFKPVNTSFLQIKGLNLSDTDQANVAIATLTDSIQSLTAERARLGAFQNRLESSSQSLNLVYENTVASLSNVEDLDITEQMVNFTKNQILSNVNTALLSQANVMAQSVLRLFA